MFTLLATDFAFNLMNYNKEGKYIVYSSSEYQSIHCSFILYLKELIYAI